MAAALAPLTAIAAGDAWTAFDIGGFGGSTRVVGLNASGQVVGASADSAGNYLAFITGPNGVGMRHLAGLENVYSFATDLNDAGMVVGYAADGRGGSQSFITGPDGAAPRTLQAFAGGQGSVVVINASGQVAGSAQDAQGNFRYFLTGANGHGVTDLGASSYYDNVIGITDGGRILQSRDVSGATACFLTGAGGQGGTTIPVAAGLSCHAAALSDDGRVVANVAEPLAWGTSFITGPNGVGTTPLPAGFFAEGVNGAGVVVGDALVGTDRRHAFMTGLLGQGLTDLNAFVSLPANEWLTFAYDINDAGQIIAETNLGRAFLLSPVPEPAAAVLLLLGLAGLWCLGSPCTSARR